MLDNQSNLIVETTETELKICFVNNKFSEILLEISTARC